VHQESDKIMLNMWPESIFSNLFMLKSITARKCDSVVFLHLHKYQTT